MVKGGARPTAVDVYVLSQGDLLSAAVSKLLWSTIEGRPSDSPIKMDSDLLHQYQRLMQLQASDPKGALIEWDELPAQIKKVKLMMLLRVAAAKRVSSGEYFAAVEHLRLVLPNDLATHFESIGYFAARHQYAEAARSVDAVLGLFGQDAYLELQKSAFCILQGKDRDALLFARQALATEPNLDNALLIIRRAQLNLGDVKGAVETEAKMRRKKMKVLDAVDPAYR